MKKKLLCVIFVLVMILSGCNTSKKDEIDKESDDFMRGGVLCDYLNKRYWPNFYSWTMVHPMKTLTDEGMNWVRAGVTTLSCPILDETPVEEWGKLEWQSEFWSCRQYAGQILKEAEQYGAKKMLFMFLSDDAAHAGQQKIPEAWKDLDYEGLKNALRDNCYETAKYFVDKGIKIDKYEIGNEIERGILEYRPGEKITFPLTEDQFSPSFLSKEVWRIEAELLTAAIEGVKKADPDAEIGLHICGLGATPNDELVTGFYEYMDKAGVDYDFIGLSYYWYYPYMKEPYFKSEQMKKTMEALGSTGKDVIFSEWAYANSSLQNDYVADTGYPYTEEGQEQWCIDFMNFCKENEYIKGSFYFYPEYYPDISNGATIFLEDCGLFYDQITPAKAIKLFNP